MFNVERLFHSKRRSLGLTSMCSQNAGASYLPGLGYGHDIRSFLRRRHSRTHVGAFLCSCLLLVFLWAVSPVTLPVAVFRSASHDPQASLLKNPPPLYEQWYEFEQHLPQQNESLPYPEGVNASFFYASNHVWGLGFNNALQEQLFLSHLAYIANRTYVFDVYTWNPDPDQPFTYHYGRWIPSRIPLTAFIAGPTAGGSFDKNEGAPRAVTKAYFQKLCPKPTLIRSSDVNAELGARADANVLMSAWVKKLGEMKSSCIEVGKSGQIFDYMVFGDGKRMLPFMDGFLKSPILKRFAWSSLVDDAVSTNIHLLSDAPQPAQVALSPIRVLQPDDEPEATTPLPGLLSIHVRRGDYQEHCQNLARWKSRFMGWLQSPLIVDRFEPPAPGTEQDETSITSYYMEKCWPSIENIVSKIDEVRWTPQGRGLKRVYIMTNDQTNWVAELKEKVMNSGGWDSVMSSADLTLVPEQKYIGQAVDMAIAMRSQMFIGNGFSSLSANVVILRMSRRFDPLTNRLW